ncbi:hypothetical protein SDC9_190176 [bioreactor metagenome]|uniref:Uncharacterized protein n=1 Tax=bioreactor metagenome TaxID=1076179 RepID=A0A645HWQ5_9ZZZZ
MGQHGRRNRTGTPQTRPGSPLHDHPAPDGQQRREIRQNRRRQQRLARPEPDQRVRLLPVLAQLRRRTGRKTDALLQPAAGGRDQAPLRLRRQHQPRQRDPRLRSDLPRPRRSGRPRSVCDRRKPVRLRRSGTQGADLQRNRRRETRSGAGRTADHRSDGGRTG